MLSFFPSLIFGLILINYAQPSTATISVSPQSITAAIGQNFSINVNITNVLDLYGWELKLSWNQTLLDAVDAIEGPFLKAGGSTFFSPRINNTAGYVLLDCTLVGYILGVNGSGILATITFHVKDGGECPLDLCDVILLNSLEQLIPSQAEDGYGHFTYSHDVALANVSVSPTIVLPGDMVNINVTVQNQGVFAEVFNVTVNASLQIIGVQTVSLDSGSSTTITFVWNTTNFGKGEYAISASASIVPGEADTTDNTRSADSIVTILNPGHDVAIIEVVPSKTIVGQSFFMAINVTAKNYGIFSENFNVTVYINATSLQSQKVTLTSGNRVSIIFTWNTTDFVKGNYTIKAIADIVPGEIETEDNTFIDCWIFVAIVGDVDGNGKVDMVDIWMISKRFGRIIGNPEYDPNCDIDDNGKIDMIDIWIAAKNFGQIDP